MLTVWTIGHSNLEWHKFAHLLAVADIGAVADVRSWPSSRLSHFSRTSLRDRLNTSGISYLFFGHELGGRPNGGAPADYIAMAAKSSFLDGLKRVEEIAARTRLALMCSEHEPLACHRCLLVGRALADRGVSMEHILRDGRIEPHAHTEERLLKLTRQTEADLLAPREERLARAYRSQNLRIIGGIERGLASPKRKRDPK